MRSLPFFIDDLNGGFMMLEGILRMEGDELTFEFQKKDALFEAYKSDLKEIRIPLSSIDVAEFKKGLFGTKLILHAKRAAVFKDLPGNDLTVRTLKVKRKHRETAASVSSRINLKISEMKLKELGE